MWHFSVPANWGGVVNVNLRKLPSLQRVWWSKRSIVYIIARSLPTGLLHRPLWIIASLIRLWRSLKQYSAELWPARPPGKILITLGCRCPATQNAPEEAKSPAALCYTVLTVIMAVVVQRYEFTSLTASYDVSRKCTMSQLNQCENRSSYEIPSWQHYMVDCTWIWKNNDELTMTHEKVIFSVTMLTLKYHEKGEDINVCIV